MTISPYQLRIVINQWTSTETQLAIDKALQHQLVNRSTPLQRVPQINRVYS